MTASRQRFGAFAAALIALVAVGWPGRGWGQFVYVNNNIGGSNSISAFAVGAGGTLSAVTGSPFATGGGGSFSPDVGAVDLVVAGMRLYASNAIGNSIAAFDIKTDGSLVTIPGSPFPTLATRPVGIAINSTGTRLFAADFNSNNVAVFNIASNGALTLVPFAPFGVAAGPLALAIDTANSLLFASHSAGGVGVYTIAGDGSLTSVGLTGAGGAERGLDINAAKTRLYVADGAPNNTVSGFNIGVGGTLTPVTDSPFTAGTDPTGVLFHPSLDVLYVSNDQSNDISAYEIAVDGSLSDIGSPVASGANGASGMAIDAKNNRLFVINGGSNGSPGRSISVFTIAGDGSLTAVGAPVATGAVSGSPTSITLANACGAAPMAGCRTAGKTSLYIKQTTPDDKDALKWKWKNGQNTTQGEFGQPFNTRTYALCVYDNTGLVLSVKVAGDAACGSVPCWTPIKTTGLKYKDKLLASDGILSITAKGSTASKSSIQLTGKGANLPDPVLPFTGTVTAQFINTSSGVCFGSSYTGAQITKNLTDQFRAKTP